MYATATLGPTLYLGLSSLNKKAPPIPWIRIQLILSITITIVSSVFFFTERNSAHIAQSLLVNISAFMYLASLLLLFPAMAFEHERRRSDASQIQIEDQNSFIDRYSKHRG